MTSVRIKLTTPTELPKIKSIIFGVHIIYNSFVTASAQRSTRERINKCSLLVIQLRELFSLACVPLMKRIYKTFHLVVVVVFR